MARHINDIGEFIIGFDPIGPQNWDAANPIGQFSIGFSAIGPQSTFDWWATVLSEYANSPVLIQMLQDAAAWFDQSLNLDNFTDLIWDVATAQGYGLDVWGRIVGVQRVVQITADDWLGLTGPPGTSGDSLNVKPFFSGGSATNNYALSDDAFRQLILAKAAANISDGGIADVNRILLALFPGRGNCYVAEGTLTAVITFEFDLTPVEISVISQSGVLPLPPGVAVTVVTP
jgi:hypothetical protein